MARIALYRLPLVFEKLEMARARALHEADSLRSEDFLNFFCGIGEEFDRAVAEARYYDLIRKDGSVFGFPKHERFLAAFAN
ncbi:MAG: hypothetical protein V1784_05370, partial [bacterium]